MGELFCHVCVGGCICDVNGFVPHLHQNCESIYNGLSKHSNRKWWLHSRSIDREEKELSARSVECERTGYSG